MTRRPSSEEKGQTRSLRTPAVPLLVPASVFDAFAWCESDVLEWRRPADLWDGSRVDRAENPSGMTFVLRGSRADFLPRELARLHAVGYGLADEWALAPYGIDDATDLLYAHRTKPADVMWLAADGLRALVWGLHDWSHFHNHGSFEERAWTELQCDASALVWLWINRQEIPEMSETRWNETRDALASVSRTRFEEEKKSFDEEILSRDALREIADKIA
ncbi:MAG: hypothetical protein ACRELY_16915 [Polyangiaceae bacterium]